jgi:hypothetical protein
MHAPPWLSVVLILFPPLAVTVAIAIAVDIHTALILILTAVRELVPLRTL